MTDDLAGKLIDLTERLIPWAKYRGRARLVEVEDPKLPDVTVAREPSANGTGGLVVFIRPQALWDVRQTWPHGRQIDSIPSDDEIAAWLAHIVIDKGGDRGTE